MQAYDHWVKQAQAADPNSPAREEAFAELIAQFQSMAHGWAYNALGDAHLAQDVVQEAFLTAYQKLDQLREPDAFPGWLKRIVLTYCNRVTRRKSPSLLPLEDEDAQADPAASAEDHDLREQVNQAVRSLPDHEREVTELFYITGYSQQEIAEQLALPLTTVKKRLQYAREHLRETMPQMSLLDPQAAFSFFADDPLEDDDLFGLSDDMRDLLALLHPELLVTA